MHLAPRLAEDMLDQVRPQLKLLIITNDAAVVAAVAAGNSSTSFSTLWDDG
jgi:hypothetical protein